MVFVPALSGTVAVALAQVSQELVGGKSSVPADVPLTVRVIGRLAVVPLAYRKVSVAVPAEATLTVHSTDAPTALVVLQNPVPEKPVWSESIVPWHTAFSASYRVAAATAGPAPAVSTANGTASTARKARSVRTARRLARIGRGIRTSVVSAPRERGESRTPATSLVVARILAPSERAMGSVVRDYFRQAEQMRCAND